MNSILKNVFTKYFSLQNLLIGFLLILITILNLHAQNAKIVFERIGKEQGLVPGNINDIMQDSVGFIWLATENGLCRYDGYSFVYYKYHANDPASLSYNHVFSLLEDKNGIIWVGTLGGGLNKFDSKTGKFQRFTYDARNPKSISSNNVFKVYRDSKKRIWISTLGGGLNLFDPINETFRHFTHDPQNPNSISSNMVSALYEDKKNNFWIGTFDGGMNLLLENENRFIRYRNDPADKYSIGHNQVMEFLEDNSGRFWVATFGNGINLFDRKNRKFYNIKNDPEFPIKPENLNVRKLFEDETSIWVGTYNGLFKFDKKNFSKTVLYSYPNQNNTIDDNKIRSIYKDRTGVMWLGTISGINKYDTMRKNFEIIYFSENYKSLLDNLTSMPAKYITKKILWAGPEKSAIVKSDQRKIRFFARHNLHKNNRSWNASNLYLDEKNNLWIGSYNGLHFYDASRKEFHNIQYSDDGTSTHGNNFVKWFYVDSKDRFWAGTMAGGLTLFDAKKNQITKFNHVEPDLKTLGDSRVNSVLEDSRGIIWISTFGGLDVFNEKDNTFKHYRSQPNDSASLSNDRIYDIYESKTGDLWIGTYLGLNKYNRATDNFERFNTVSGLGDITVYSIQEDETGNLWIRTNDGITKFDPVKKTFNSFNSKDGIPNVEFNGNIFYKNNDGKMFFGFSNGLISLYPSDIKSNPYQPRVALTKLTIMEQEVPVGEDSPLKKSINETSEVVLSYRDKIIGVEFSALHYSISSKNKFAYKLDGVLDKWVFVDANNRTVKFTNLDPGEYTLRIKASNNDGIWSDVEKSLKIIITPPFWATWWFRISVLVLFLILIFVFYEIRLNRLIGFERTRTRIARNLHDEVGGTLSSIQYFVRAVEKSLTGNESANTKKYLTLISESSADAQEKIKDLIWTVSPNEDGLSKFLVKLNRYASDLFDSKEINYKINLPTGNMAQEISMEKRQHLWCICKETITNIVKHSHCKNVVVNLNLTGKILELAIEDDGKGFNESEKLYSNGVVNIRQRADALNAEYKLTTQINNGTKWYFKMKI